MAKEIAEEYTSSLADLTLNSKPLINMLTMLADDNIEHAESIVEAVEKHLDKVRSEFKLPVLYLIDSIVKNVGHAYTNLFTQNIVNTFCSVFEKVDEKVRAQMFKLRQTWADVFPAKKLYTLDIRVQCIDPAWPLIAPTPTPSIHVNPKFFAKPAVPVVTPTVAPAVPPKAPPAPVQLNSATLDMQTQLINKQKELLELKQKKLELELLQAKAKLEEQEKQLERQSIQIKTPQQLLLKPEVAKQLLQGVKSDDSGTSGKVANTLAPTSVKSSVGATNSSGSPRIAPVNSALLASVRPVLRDPRLLRQQPSAAGAPPPAANPITQLTQNNTTSNNSNYETVNLVDEKQSSNKVTKKSLHTQNNSTINLDCVIIDSNSKSNKAGALNRSKDPRLISNKVQGSKSKLSPNNGRSSERSPKKPSTISRKSTKTSSNNSRSSFKSPVLATDTTGKSAGKISDTTVTVKSPTSPSKYVKKLKDSPKSAADPKRVKSKESKVPRTRDRDKFDDDCISPSPTVPAAPVLVVTDQQRVFKGLKMTAKNRNYIRRNRAISISPEPSQDVDLRVPPEKQARLHSDEDTTKSTTIDDIPSNKDVDLRTLVIPAPVNKKRSSTEKLEGSNAKKSKSQMFDVLFGNEDVDLRQLPPVLTTPVVTPSKPAVIRPPTPPPPIISTPPTDRMDTNKEIAKSKPENIAKANLEAKRAKSNLDAIRTKTNLDAIRAKLANATKISALSEESRKASEDTDMRQEALQKIIISQADEQLIRNGNLSQALVEKVLTLFETQKLQEAQRRESEEFKPDPNITLQPISDDELSVDFSHSESDDDKVPRKPDALQVFQDTDERVAPPAPMISQNQNEIPQKTELNEQERQQGNVDPRLQNRVGPQNMEAWQGHHRRRRPKTHWDSPPPHTGPDPWLRPPPVLNQTLNQAMNQGMYGPRRPFPGFIRPPGDFGPRMDFVPQFVDGSRSPPSIGSQNTRELPMADPLVLEYIEQDTMRTINIDGRPREIRYYEETAIVIMSWDDPREISFQNGTRIITFDDKESFTLSFNDAYRDVTIGGKPHRIRLGAPTRELYIDGKWYECFFGGPGIGIEVDGQIRVVKMEGPAPHVKIGTVKRTDYVAGKINLIINARQMVPVFLDAKPQKFDIEGKIHTLRFVDALRTVLINEVPFKVEFGGLPKPITVHDKKHFIRFSVLPRGVKPGYITLANMEGTRFPSPPRIENENETVEPFNVQANEPALPMLGKRRLRQTESPDSSRNSPTMQNQSQLGSLDVLSSIMTSPMANSSNVTGYQVDNNQDSQDSFPVLKATNEIPGLSIETPVVPSIPNNLNINELFQKLIASGIVTSAKEKTPPPVQEEIIHHPIIRPILFNKSETLKLRQQPLITALYSGMQCSSCGVRFPPEHSMQYSQHLDWHFRQNRRGRNSARKALCRKWYYDVSDWKNFEEIEDIEEREKNWFESQQQQQQAEGAGEDGDEEIEIPSVPADANTQSTACEVCRDKFDQFYNEEKEEWHLRMAIRVDEKTYHPLCYDDHKTSLLETTIEEPPEQKEVDPTPEDTEVKIEELIMEEHIIKTEEEAEKMEVEEDDDVVIQEPKIEQIEIDDRMDVDEKEELKTEKDDDLIFQSDIYIKEEPIDEFDISGIKTEALDSEIEGIGVPMMERVADTTRAELLSSIDGNVQQMVSGPSGISGKIKITITKPMLVLKESTNTTTTIEPDPGSSTEPTVDANEPLPPGEEPVQLNLKPALQNVTLTKQPTVIKGTELTGLCSIM